MCAVEHFAKLGILSFLILISFPLTPSKWPDLEECSPGLSHYFPPELQEIGIILLISQIKKLRGLETSQKQN